jgi:hypothetical protein
VRRTAKDDTPYTEQERLFLAAIDRIRAGEPTEPSLKAKAAAGRVLEMNVTTVAQEAGYARTYLYKNRKSMRRVWSKIEEVTTPQSSTTARDIIRRLQEHNRTLIAERNVAIDATRRCMQEMASAKADTTLLRAKERLEREVKTLKAQLLELRAENAKMIDRDEGNKVVPFRKTDGQDG